MEPEEVRAEFSLGVGNIIGVLAAKGDPRPNGGQRRNDPAPDPASAAGDERDFAGEVERAQGLCSSSGNPS